MALTHTAHVTVRHHELDRFGRVHPAVYLRYLAHAAVEASTAAGFDAAWYADAGSLWLVRRSTFEVSRPIVADDRLAIDTWVEDFRRVRSHRRYTVRGADGRVCLDAVTDWVYVDAATGRPRRIPAHLERGFEVRSGPTAPRDGWSAPPPPAAPARAEHRVCAHELDALAHVNNAVYLDLVAQAVLDALDGAGWSLDRMIADGAVPVLAGADVEYLEAAQYGDRLEIATWFTPAARGLHAHHVVARRDGKRPCVQATTRWRWADPAYARDGDLPAGLLAALEPLVAA